METVQQASIQTFVRHVEQIYEGIRTSDGAGVDLRRYIGTRELMQIDPFLLMDEFFSDEPESYIRGFPDHPHRGFETVTYLIQGRMRHRDSMGNEGLLTSGSMQWMTAGRGVIHSEMPAQDGGLLRGTQLWVNLPARDKMIPPRYQDIAPEQIPVVQLPGGVARVLAGSLLGTAGPAQTHTPIVYYDVMLEGGSVFTENIEPDFNVFLQTLEGECHIEERHVPARRTVLLSSGNMVRVHSPGGPCRFLLIGGRPIREPIVRGGPFVMNTREEILRAFSDYETGHLDR